MTINQTARSMHFSGVYSNFNADNLSQYSKAFGERPSDHQFKPCATRIFRELQTTLGITKLIGKNPCDVHILGCSDGSEAYAYAIAFKESVGNGVGETVKIIGVDYTPSLVEMAKTGHLVCTDQEKIWSNDRNRAPQNPLAGAGWDKYLEQSSAPSDFEALQKQYPELVQLTRDPVAKIQIGQGMHWYKVKTEVLPPVDFKAMDMREYVQTAPSDKKKQVYVVANSLAYIAQKEGLPAFLKVLQDIQNNNVGKEAYVVLGDVELQVFAQRPQLMNYMRLFGQPVSEKELNALDVPLAHNAVGKIWKLNPMSIIKINF